ncbi:hypothetical protein DSO57_1029834 [Entomophthora muscae]|uniref:Uncharacterized protein n=1 Tax=Entomophthora muscae TaxID=34485 RepID=A0ACC2UA33_9FUNG|nr:hypothetical protein DSO57_1029834 [Entomophthora muscae]
MNLWFNQVIPYLILVLFHLQSASHGSAPHTHQPQETADQLHDLYCPPGAPYSPVHFTKYPPNPAYLEFTLEEILIHDPEARTRETETVYREGTKITITPLLFRDKCNYLPTYLVPMTLSLTLWPNRLQESVTTNESTSTQIFGVMYITLTGLIDSMVPASRPWALLGKLLSYIIKLAPILWWALPAGPAGCLPASSQEPPTGWIPDTTNNIFNSTSLSLLVPITWFCILWYHHYFLCLSQLTNQEKENLLKFLLKGFCLKKLGFKSSFSSK